MDIHCLAIMNNAAINTGVQRSESPLLVLLRIFPEGEVLNHMVIHTFTFLRDHHTVFTAAALFYEPTYNVQGFQFFYIPSTVAVFWVFGFCNSQPDGYLFVGVSCISLATEHPFVCLLSTCVSSLEKCRFMSCSHLKVFVVEGFFIYFGY